MGRRRPKIRLDLLTKGERRLIVSRPVRGALAAQAAVPLAKGMPHRPPNLADTTASLVRKFGRSLVDLGPRTGVRVLPEPRALLKALIEGATAKRVPVLVTDLGKISETEWLDLLIQMQRNVGVPFEKRLFATGGMLLEVFVPGNRNFEFMVVRVRSKLKRLGGLAERVFVVRRAVTPGDVNAVADYLVIAVNKPEAPTRMRLLAVIESKGRNNAIEIIHEGAYGDIKPGKPYGQPEAALERIRKQGLDLRNATVDGLDKHPILREWKPEEITGQHEPGLPPEQQTTELIGVVPSDTPTRDAVALADQAKKRGIQLWQHNISAKDALTTGAELLKAFDHE